MNNPQGWQLENSYVDLPKDFFTKIYPTPVISPKLILFNNKLAKSLGIDLTLDDKETITDIFSGNKLPKAANPIAQAYAGHQFGHFSILGDGRAHLIGEQITPTGKRFDIQLKGSGQTPYSRGGDGRAAVGPMLREYLISEAMHALKIPTTRSLAVVLTGESVMRSSLFDGAILTRVAASHLRIGTFEYANKILGYGPLKQLADYAIKRHYPELNNRKNSYLAFLIEVIERQAKLIASWMHFGFIHGVMNTDNMTISGETIDYGPCAFLDTFSMERVFSSIDYHGRYKYGGQAHVAQWNLSKLAESLIPLIHKDSKQASELAEAALDRYSEVFNNAWLQGMRSKLGIDNDETDDLPLVQKLFDWMEFAKVDFTKTFRDLGKEYLPNNVIYNSKSFQEWYVMWEARRSRNTNSKKSSFALMQKNNPIIAPNNYYVEKALEDAEKGDLAEFENLLTVLQNPFEETILSNNYVNKNIQPDSNYKTFCGT